MLALGIGTLFLLTEPLFPRCAPLRALSPSASAQEFLIYAAFTLLSFSAACGASSTCSDDPIVDNFGVCTGARDARLSCVRALRPIRHALLCRLHDHNVW